MNLKFNKNILEKVEKILKKPNFYDIEYNDILLEHSVFDSSLNYLDISIYIEKKYSDDIDEELVCYFFLNESVEYEYELKNILYIMKDNTKIAAFKDLDIEKFCHRLLNISWTMKIKKDDNLYKYLTKKEKQVLMCVFYFLMMYFAYLYLNLFDEKVDFLHDVDSLSMNKFNELLRDMYIESDGFFELFAKDKYLTKKM